MERIYLSENYDHAFDYELRKRFRGILPSRIFDAHFHLSPGEIHSYEKSLFLPEFRHEEDPQSDLTFYREHIERYLGKGRLCGGLLMGNPKRFQSLEDADTERTYGCELTAASEGFVSGLLARPTDDQKHIADFIARYPRIAALKPYRSYAAAEDTFEADIPTYAPEWMWEIAEQHSLPVVIHLSHYGDMLNDAANIRDIRYLCVKYPHAKMVLAHCALGHHPDKLKSGIPKVVDLPNLYMDCSGISEALSIIYSLRTFGPSRVMFGTDGFGFGIRTGRCMPLGGNFLGIHKDLSLPPDYHYRPINALSEGLLALTSACDVLGTTADELDEIYYRTAANLYYGACR